jgi:HD-GYP domain-containing protein (c-di-GMP phosphodiesterase class II)
LVKLAGGKFYVGVLETAFARALGLDDETVRVAGMGGLLHDIGKILVPDDILNKPGPLTEEEYEDMKHHVARGRAVLETAAHIHAISVEVAYQHHERMDGSGYPRGLHGPDISLLSKMVAICDVYDALTSDRVYRKAMPAHEALRHLFEWSAHHFDRDLVQQFVRLIGIYPAGTHVLLKSRRIALVLEQSEETLLKPVVRVFWDAARHRPLQPFVVDLSDAKPKGGVDEIQSAVDLSDRQIPAEMGSLISF